MKKISKTLLMSMLGLSLALTPFAASNTLAAGDTTAPSAPSNVSAALNVGGQIFLTWAPSTDNVGVTGYTILRNSSVLANTASTSYIDTSVSPNTTYSYTVLSFDAAGNISSASNTVSISTEVSTDTTPPSAPTNLTASAISDKQIDLAWTEASDNVSVTGYMIIRNNSILANTANNSYSDLSVQPSTNYSYSVMAFDAAGNISPVSNVASATTNASPIDINAPSVPMNLVASAISTSQIDLSWTASTDDVGVIAYNIYRDNNLIATSTANTFSDTGLSPATVYSYSVSAYDAAANVSAMSVSVSASTLTVTETNDIIPPSTPSNLSATVASSSSTQVNLDWTASTDNVGVLGYAIIRTKTKTNNGVSLSSLNNNKFIKASDYKIFISKTNSFTDNTAQNNNSYTYQVLAFDISGNLSGLSNAATITLGNPSSNNQGKSEDHKNDHSENKEHRNKEKNNNHHSGQDD